MNLALAIAAPVALGLFYSWISRINAVYFFGRTVKDELKSAPEARAITRQYVGSIAAATATSAVVAFLAVHAVGRRFLALGVVTECVFFALIYARANRRVANLLAIHTDWCGHTPVREAPLVAQAEYWVPSFGAILIPLSICIASVIAALLFAAHRAGLPARWAAFSAGADAHGYSSLFGLATGMMCAAVGLLVLFRTSARLRTRMAQYTLRACLVMEWIATVLLIAMLISNASGLVLSRTTAKSVTAVALCIAFATLWWNQFRFCRFVPAAVEMGDDERWHWGLFYVDRNDPALFVQSRCGAGYTLNYGRALAWPISLGVVAYILGMLLFLPPHVH